MFLRKRLDLTVEAIIHDNRKWHPLFKQGELDKCTERLGAVHYRRGRFRRHKQK